MSETALKLAGKLPKDAGIVGYAGDLYDKLGDSYLVVGRVIVDRAARSKSGDRETRLVLDKLELCVNDWKDDAQKLLEGTYEARTGGDTLPFPGDDELARKRHQHVKAALEHWFAEKDMNPQAQREDWVRYFGDVDTPVGPAGASYVHLREYAFDVKAVDETTMPGPMVGDNAAPEDEPAKPAKATKTKATE
jgi:hypothetical protein